MNRFDILRTRAGSRTRSPTWSCCRTTGSTALRFAAPLVLASQVGVRKHWLAPRFVVAGVEVVMDVFNLAALPVERLGSPVGTLEGEDARARLMRALDGFISQA